MNRSFLRSTLGAVMLSALLGCSNPTEYATLVYDACYSVDDCVLAATLCEELTVEFGGELWSNAICTLGCATDGAVSPDCPRALVGRFGSCYPSSLAGGIDDSLICFEPCDVTEDCAPGFQCLDALDLCGVDEPSCAIDQGDAICVPSPY
ncbi:MAG: hypothetical protein WCE62_13565 [Polyangiales bacterium]